MSKSVSNLPIWIFFERTDDVNKSAVCNYCSKKLSYQTTITNLKAHLKMKHKSEYKFFLKLATHFKSDAHKDENKVSVADKMERKPRKSSLPLWKYFKKSGGRNKIATCRKCRKKLSYKTTTTNLKTHLRWKHKTAYIRFLNLNEKMNLESATTLTPSDKDKDVSKDVSFDNEKDSTHMDNVQPIIWNFFGMSTDENKTATCNYCTTKVSYETTINDLKEHLKTEHITEYNTFLNMTKQLELDTALEKNISIAEKNATETCDANMLIWKYFEKSDNGNEPACCKICNRKLFYRTTITNLKTHLRIKHNSEYINFLNLTAQPESVTSPGSSSDSEEKENDVSFENEDNSTPMDNVEPIISYFYEMSNDENKTATCNYCSAKVSYKTTINDLKAHLQEEHITEYNAFVTKQLKSDTALENNIAIAVKRERKPRSSSNILIWKYFKKSVDINKTAFCRKCGKKLSYRSTITNLKTHLRIKHNSLYKHFLKEAQLESVQAPGNSSDNEEKDFTFENEDNDYNTSSGCYMEPIIWNFFEISNDNNKTAICNYCGTKLHYENTTKDLKEHLKMEHISEYNTFLNLSKQLESVFTENSTSVKESAVENEEEVKINSMPYEIEIEGAGGVCDSPPTSEDEKNIMQDFSPIWKFFEKSHDGNKTAICNYCNSKLSYRTSVTNLKSHLKAKHISQYNVFYDLTKQLESQDARKKCPSDANSPIWQFFGKSRSGKKKAVCYYCGTKLSYKSTIFSLKNHLETKHSSGYDIFLNKIEQLQSQTTRHEFESEEEDVMEETENVGPPAKGEKEIRNRGINRRIWKYFKKLDHVSRLAICRYCNKKLSYATTISNLKTHLKKKHIRVYSEFLEQWSRKCQRLLSGSNGSISSSSESERRVGASEPDILPSKRLRKSLKESLVASGYNERSNDTEDSLLVPIKRRYSSEITDEDAAEQAAETEADVWSYFEKMPSNRARCILCKETFNRHLPFLTCHMNEKHRKVVMDLPSDSDDDQNCYTEVVYLEDEQTANVPLTETKPKRMKQTPEKQRKRTSSSRYEFVKPKEEEIDSKNDEAEEEIENFGRYIIGLLKKMPKDVSTQLQMDVISMIMTTKLKLETSLMESANGSVSSVQDGVAVTPGNVIVTTPSNVIHTGENNVSVPSLVIGIEKES